MQVCRFRLPAACLTKAICHLWCTLQRQCLHRHGDSIFVGFLMLSPFWSHLVDCQEHPTTLAHDSRHQCHCSTLQFKGFEVFLLQLFIHMMNKSWICNKCLDVLSEELKVWYYILRACGDVQTAVNECSARPRQNKQLGAHTHFHLLFDSRKYTFSQGQHAFTHAYITFELQCSVTTPQAWRST